MKFSDAALSVYRTVRPDQVAVTDVASRWAVCRSGRWYTASEAEASEVGRRWGWEAVARIESDDFCEECYRADPELPCRHRGLS